MVRAEQDAATASSLFADFAMGPMCAVIKANPRKRQGVLAVMYSFSTQSWEDHANVIRLLQETLDDLPTFISALTHLIYLETEFDVRGVPWICVCCCFAFYYAHVACVRAAGPVGHLPILLPDRHGPELPEPPRRVVGHVGSAGRE